MKSRTQTLMIVALFAVTGTAFGASIKNISDGLMGPVGFLTDMMHYASYVIGAMMIIGAIMQYRIHLQNPKLTPLLTPITMVLIGTLLLLVPYLANIFGNSWSVENQKATGQGAKATAGHISTNHPRAGGPETKSHWTD